MKIRLSLILNCLLSDFKRWWPVLVRPPITKKCGCPNQHAAMI